MIEPRIVVNNRNGIFFIKPVDVLYIHAQGSYSVIKLLNGTEIKLSCDIKNIPIVSQVAQYFMRTHRSWMININHVDRIESNYKFVIMVDETKIPATYPMCKLIIAKYRVEEAVDSVHQNTDEANNSLSISNPTDLPIMEFSPNDTANDDTIS